MTTPTPAPRTRRLRAAIIGFGLEDVAGDAPRRLLTSEHGLVVGGSAEAQADWVETLLRLESELERLGCGLGDLKPQELAEVAWRIDSAELHDIAVRLGAGIEHLGRDFADLGPAELTDLAAGEVA